MDDAAAEEGNAARTEHTGTGRGRAEGARERLKGGGGERRQGEEGKVCRRKATSDCIK
jgi:hypothetical protein